MASVIRGAKTSAGGGTEFADDTPALASEVNADFNTLFGALQGNLNDTNIDTLSWSKITGTKNPEDIDDSSATTAEMDADKDPGDASSLNLSANLEEEIQSIRRQLKRLGVGEGVVRRDTSGTPANEDVSWVELPARGPNLIPNGALDVYTGDASSQDAPDLWTKAATPTTLEPVSLGLTEGEGQAVHIVADAASEGIQTTVGGLKASTRYLLQVKAKVASGSFTVTTDHSDGSTWDDADRTITGSSYAIYGFVLVTDASATDLDVNLHSDASGDDFTVAWVSLREISDRPIQDVQQSSAAMYDFVQFQDTMGATGSFVTVNGNTNKGSSEDVAVSVDVPDHGTYAIEVFWVATAQVNTQVANDTARAEYQIDVTGAVTEAWPAGNHELQANQSEARPNGQSTIGGRRYVWPAENGSTYNFALQHAEQPGDITTIGEADDSVSEGSATHLGARVFRIDY